MDSFYNTELGLQSAESRKDFVRKLKIIQKGLKESRLSLKIAWWKPLSRNIKDIESGLKETEELNKIIYKSIQTALSNSKQ